MNFQWTISRAASGLYNSLGGILWPSMVWKRLEKGARNVLADLSIILCQSLCNVVKGSKQY